MGIRKSASTTVTTDLLKQKQAEVTRLGQQAQKAVDIVTRTMDELECVNKQIDTALDEIDAYIKDLSTTREAMSQQRKNNTTIIGNFAKLLDAGTEAGG